MLLEISPTCFPPPPIIKILSHPPFSAKLPINFFNTVLVNGESIDNTDWVAAFNGDICVGAQQWTCEGSCEVPIYGEYSLNEDTEGYMLPGDFPSFKIYDGSEGQYYPAEASNNFESMLLPVANVLVISEK